MIKNFTYKYITEEENKFKIVRNILLALPEWFNKEGIKEYSEAARKQILLVAFDGEKAVGFVALQHNNNYTSCIYSTGVLKEYHRNGVGKILINKVENYLMTYVRILVTLVMR